MSHKIQIIKNLHKDFRSDPYLNDVLGSGGLKLDYISDKAESVEKEFWFDTMSAVGIAIMENQMDYKTMGKTIEEKREEIEGRWKIAGKCDLQLLQAIANSWRNGQVAVMFTNAVIEVTFISITGIPMDVDALKSAIDNAKPAHLPINYTFKYRTHKQLHPFKHLDLKKYTHKQLRELEIITIGG